MKLIDKLKSIKKEYDKKHLEHWEYCAKYGHGAKITKNYSGIVISKQKRCTRVIEKCSHCGHVFKKTDTEIDKEPQRYGVETLSSAGVCYDCKKNGHCDAAPRPIRTYPSGISEIAYVYGFCPINAFEPKIDEKEWKKTLESYGDMMELC